MGYALAEAAMRRGARVVLVTGPVALAPPAGAEVLRVETTEEMRAAVLQRLPEATIVIKAAAVSDFRPRAAADQKLKRGRQELFTLELQPTSDIIAEVARKAGAGQIIVGFAAETQNALENARRKLVEKSLHAIVANDVSCPGIGFDSDRNAVSIITAEEEIVVLETSKQEVARRVLDVVCQLRRQGVQKLTSVSSPAFP